MIPEHIEALPAVRYDIHALPNEFELTVTTEHLHRALDARALGKFTPYTCPIAQAFADATGVTPDSPNVFAVYKQRLRVGQAIAPYHASFLIPAAARSLIDFFDNDQVVAAELSLGTFRFTRVRA